jgi:hypothetical protein
VGGGPRFERLYKKTTRIAMPITIKAMAKDGRPPLDS